MKRGRLIVAALAAASVCAGALFISEVNEQRVDGPREAVPRTVATTTATPVSATDAIVPTTLAIPALGLRASVDAKGTEQSWDPFLAREVTSFGVPATLDGTTWWSDGPRPGDAGMAVILGHAQPSGGGAFGRIETLTPGSEIDVADGPSQLQFRTLQVVSGLPKSDPNALGGALQSAPEGARLALVTCDGEFDHGVGGSVANTVVFAA